MRKITSVFVILIMLFVLTGCTNKTSTTAGNKTSTENKISTTNTTNTTNTESEIDTMDYKAAAEKQMAVPNEGETIAIFKIKNFGEIKVKFFDDIAPKAVENFVTHAKEGYYDGVTFHRVIEEFMIQGGDPKGTGRGGESIWGTGFAEELAYELVPYRGSLCMASGGVGTSSLGSQFFITQANYSEAMETYLKQYQYPSGLLETYKQYGGYMSLYLQYTVFGQVYEGMDIVDKIAKVETHTTDAGQENKPVEDVVIETIEVTTYSAK